jgi:hypothetical protein
VHKSGARFGYELIGDESTTQDFTGLSAPTFTTPNITENLKLQRHLYRGTPALYFLDPFGSHLLDAVMQGLFAKAWAIRWRLGIAAVLRTCTVRGRPSSTR